MAIKIYYNDSIHRLAKLPESLQALIAHIKSLFKDELPLSWKLQFLDSDGDMIAISHDHDYKELCDLESSTPGTTTKLYIVPTEGLPKDLSHNPAKYPSFEEYEVIKTSENVPKEEIISQDKEEKTAVAEEVKSDSPQNFEVKPQPENEDNGKKDKKQMKNAKELLKKFISGKYPEITKEQFETELNAIRETLTEEKKQKLDKKREKLEDKLKKNREKGLKENRHKANKFEKGPSEYKLNKFLKIFKKAFKAQKKGKVEKAAKFKEELFAIIPEEGKQTLEDIFTSFPEDLDKNLDKDTIEQRFIDKTRKLVEESFPERKDEILADFDSFLEMEKRKQESKEHSFKEKNGNKIKEMNELKEKYSKIVFKKVKILRMVFPKEEVTKLCQYVSQKPEELSMEELVLNYRKDV